MKCLSFSMSLSLTELLIDRDIKFFLLLVTDRLCKNIPTNDKCEVLHEKVNRAHKWTSTWEPDACPGDVRANLSVLSLSFKFHSMNVHTSERGLSRCTRKRERQICIHYSNKQIDIIYSKFDNHFEMIQEEELAAYVTALQ